VIVILSDINMPGMDGLSLPGSIKERFPDPPVMMVTAVGGDERRREASKLGAFEFLTKPVDFDRLKAQLQRLAAPRSLKGAASHRSRRVDGFPSRARAPSWSGFSKSR
jgi:DNA-binding NtrC family response regulator